MSKAAWWLVRPSTIGAPVTTTAPEVLMSQLGLTQTQAEDFLSGLSPFGEGNAIRLALADPAGDEAFKKVVLETYELYGTSQTWDNNIGVKPHTGGDQIPEQGRIDTGGDQIPERIDNTHITPLPDSTTLDDIALLSEKSKVPKPGISGKLDKRSR